MAFSYGFFDSKGLDRTYTAEDFTSYLSSLICDGILDTYGDRFSVRSSVARKIRIGTGKAWIGGHYFINDSSYTLDLDQYVDESLDRYVTLGIVCDTSEAARECKFILKVGTAENSPAIPLFENTETKTYLTLAAIRIPAGVLTISQNNITDYRAYDSLCGYCKCILGKCRVSEMLDEMVQIRQDMSGFKDGTLSDAVKELQHYMFNTADKVNFSSDTEGRLHYSDKYGNRITGEAKIKGIPYQFTDDGILKTGWRTVFGKRYYYDPETGNIQLRWVEYMGKMYYVTLSEGKLVNQHRTIDGKRYWFDSDGAAKESRCVSFPDADGDGEVSMSDATTVLNFSSECASGKYTNDEDGWEKYLNDIENRGGN